MRKSTTTVVILIVLAAFIMFFPMFLLPDAEFMGSDDRGSEMVGEITGGKYEPWFEPVYKKLMGGDMPAELETFFFCIQTGIGVGIIAFCFGYLAARKKYGGDEIKQASIKTTRERLD